MVNRTEADLAITVRGRVEGVARAASRYRIRRLTPGPARVMATPTTQATGASSHTADLALARSEVTQWDIARPDSTAPMPPALTALTVKNTTRRDLTVSLDGRPLGTVFAGAERRFFDLPAGDHSVIAQGSDARTTVATRMTLAEGDDARWDVVLTGAELTIVNGFSEAVELDIDGEKRGRIAVGQRWRSTEEQVGNRVLKAVGVVTRARFETVLELGADQASEWTLGAGKARVVVHNASGESLSVSVGQGDAREVAAGEDLIFDDLHAGERSLSASGASGSRHAADIRLAPGQTYRWSPRPLAPTLRVGNRTDKDLVIYVGGQRRGLVAAGGSGVIRRLPRGPFEVEAIDDYGEQRYVRAFDLSESHAASWFVTPLLGSISVDNQRPEGVDLYLDAKRLGTIDKHKARTFSGIPVGSHLVEAVGTLSRAVLRFDVDTGEDVVTKLTLANPTAQLTIVNETGQPLRTTGLLEPQRKTIAPRVSARFMVPVGARQLGVVAADGQTYQRSFEVAPGGELSWTVEPALATLIAWNRLSESVALAVDDQAVGTAEPEQTVVLEQLTTGRHKLQAVGLDSGRVYTEIRMLSAAEPLRWTLETRPARVVIDNASQERVEIAIAGRPFGHVEPGQARIFGNIIPGPKRLVATGATSRAEHVFELQLPDGQDELVTVKAPMGAVVVDNQTRQTVRVLADGVEIGEVAAAAGPTQLPVPAGQRLVSVERLADGSQVSFNLVLAAGQAVHLPVTGELVRLVAVNQTDVALTLNAGARVLGIIEPGTSEMYEGLAPGVVELRTTDTSGEVVHNDRRTLFAGETATWVLQVAR